MESVLLAYGGAWLAWFSSFMGGALAASVVGTLTVFNWMYNPYIYAKSRNSKFSARNKRQQFALYSSRIKKYVNFRLPL